MSAIQCKPDYIAAGLLFKTVDDIEVDPGLALNAGHVYPSRRQSVSVMSSDGAMIVTRASLHIRS